VTDAQAGPAGRAVALVLGSSTGGIGTHVASLAAGLVARGDTVTVYAPAETGRQFAFDDLGAAFVALEIPASPRPGDARAVATLRRELRARPADVIHAHGLRAGLIAALARRNGTPLVVTWHNVVLGRGIRARALAAAERYVARSADVGLGASTDLVDRARTLGGRDVRLGAVAAPTLPAPARTRAEVRAELGVTHGPLVLSVGRLHPQKGYDLLIEAAARWRSLTPAPTVAIAGTGPAYRRLAAQISSTRAPVLLLGHRTDVADLLAAADLAVVSSVWEARQLFAQEAMTAGAPLVATAVGGLPGLVGDGARLVPAGDVDALDAAVRTLLADDAQRAQLAAAGRREAAGWPNEADTITMISDVYDELTRPGRNGALGTHGASGAGGRD
jgi:glycosyltransferase involved in cell wall biosynthesis